MQVDTTTTTNNNNEKKNANYFSKVISKKSHASHPNEKSKVY